MKNKIISIILAALMVAGTTAGAVFADDSQIVLPPDNFDAGDEGNGGDDTEEPALAAGVVFKAESGMVADSYTGYAYGIPAAAVAGDVLGALENAEGIEIRRDGAAIAESDSVTAGDAIVLLAEDGSVKTEFVVIFMGDADMSGAINLSDASAMLKVVAAWENVALNESAADVDGNGAVNLSDVSSVLKKVANWDVEFVKVPVIPGKYDLVDTNNLPCHGYNPTMGWQPLCLSDGIHYDLGVKFVVKEGEFATKISFLLPSWSDNKGRLTVSIYKWTGDYNDSIAAMPIISETLVDYEDNSTIVVDLLDSSEKGLVEGEYVWRLHDGEDAGDGTGVGIWYFHQFGPAEDTGMKTFLNCKEFNIGPVSYVYYAKPYVKK